MTKRGFIFLLIIIGLVVFVNSLFNGFVWDDEEQILNNVLVHSILNLPEFFSGSTFNGGGSGILGGLYYKPLMTTFFAFLYTVFGANPFFFHFFQVGLHIANSIFVFLVFRYFFTSAKGDLIAFILALVFLVHPINVEAAVYISCLQDILFYFFGIFALWLVISKRINSTKGYFLLLSLLLCSMLSKETGLLFVLLIVFYVFLFLKGKIRLYLITSFACLMIYSFLRFIVAGIYFNKHGLTPISVLSFSERLLSVPKIIIFYLKTFLFPKDLSISQHWVVNSMSISDFFIPFVILLIVIIFFLGQFLVLNTKKSPQSKNYLFFLAWLSLGLGLHSQIIFPLDMTVSERWFYFPMVGLLGLLGIIFTQFRLNKSFKNLLLIILTILTVLLIYRTIIRNSDWKDGLTLYRHDILLSSHTFDLENNYGVELFRLGRFEEAGKHFEASTILAPSWWTNWNNLGAIAERNGNIEAAKKYYQKAIDNGQYYLAYQNLAKIYLLHDNPINTKLFCEQSLKILPNNAQLWAILAISEYRLKESDKALNSAKNAYSLEQSEQNAYIYSRLLKNLPLENQ